MKIGLFILTTHLDFARVNRQQFAERYLPENPIALRVVLTAVAKIVENGELAREDREINRARHFYSLEHMSIGVVTLENQLPLGRP